MADSSAWWSRPYDSGYAHEQHSTMCQKTVEGNLYGANVSMCLIQHITMKRNNSYSE